MRSRTGPAYAEESFRVKQYCTFSVKRIQTGVTSFLTVQFSAFLIPNESMLTH